MAMFPSLNHGPATPTFGGWNLNSCSISFSVQPVLSSTVSSFTCQRWCQYLNSMCDCFFFAWNLPLWPIYLCRNTYISFITQLKLIKNGISLEEECKIYYKVSIILMKYLLCSNKLCCPCTHASLHHSEPKQDYPCDRSPPGGVLHSHFEDNSGLWIYDL